MPGWKIVHTPGHTLGHVSLLRLTDRVLLAGDAFCTTKPESFFEATILPEPELHGPPSYLSLNFNDTAVLDYRRVA
jgi:glyoxylase-like metal-dependent hydrolase (beta-lactamase superfamily II)